MFVWITKPYIEWNIMDTIICYFEIGLGITLILLLTISILKLKDKIINKKKGK